MATILPKSDMALRMRKVLFSLVIFGFQCYYGWSRICLKISSLLLFFYISKVLVRLFSEALTCSI